MQEYFSKGIAVNSRSRDKACKDSSFGFLGNTGGVVFGEMAAVCTEEEQSALNVLDKSQVFFYQPLSRWF